MSKGCGWNSEVSVQAEAPKRQDKINYFIYGCQKEASFEKHLFLVFINYAKAFSWVDLPMLGKF